MIGAVIYKGVGCSWTSPEKTLIRESAYGDNAVSGTGV